jgi:hypothetical protein
LFFISHPVILSFGTWPPAVTNIITVHICSYTRRELRPVVFIETVQVNTNTGKQPQFSLGQYISTQLQLNNSSST